MHNAYLVANRAQMTSLPETPQVLERVQALHSRVFNHSAKVFGHAGIKSFAEKLNTLVHDSMHSFMGHPKGQFLSRDDLWIHKDHSCRRLSCKRHVQLHFLGRPACEYTIDIHHHGRLPRGLPTAPPSGRTILPWVKQQQPHTSSTRLSRFRTDVQFPSLSTHSLAVNVVQARCEVYDELINSPFRLALSEDSACLALTARGGYKERDLVLAYWLPTEGAGDEHNHVDVPLVEPDSHLVRRSAQAHACCRPRPR